MLLDDFFKKVLNQPDYKQLSQINNYYAIDEEKYVQTLYQSSQAQNLNQKAISKLSTQLIQKARDIKSNKGGIDAFMTQYDLSSQEGIVLMCLAEALLRIPDKATADKLIKDKLTQGNWESHLGESDSLFVNAATWSLMLTGKIIDSEKLKSNQLKKSLFNFLNKSSKGVIRKSVMHAMKVLGKQFVMGETIEEALKRAEKPEKIGYRHSYDMLGEAAMTDSDAQIYQQAYIDAIHAVGKQVEKNKKAGLKTSVYDNPGISVKLSALYSRYELLNIESVIQKLYPRLLKLCKLAAEYNINLTIDAEEANRLEISLFLLQKLCTEKSIANWPGLGLAVQAYQKRACSVLDYLIYLSEKYNRRFMVRLVKGAYWDAEIKNAQVLGLDNYPVFTRKPYTDLSYTVCAQKMLDHKSAFYPQFATHNARTLATIINISQNTHDDYEFQCLHGMGDVLYDAIMKDDKKEFNLNKPCRVYAPVGSHKHLLAYLVRRLLENGANSSFVNRLTDTSRPIKDLIIAPETKAQEFNFKSHPQIPLPRHLYGDTRLNASSIDITNSLELEKLADKINQLPQSNWAAGPLGDFADLSKSKSKSNQNILSTPNENPSDKSILGQTIQTQKNQINLAFESAQKGFKHWHKTPVKTRSKYLNNMADLLEKHFEDFLQIAILEAGKTLANAIAEVREAIDFCRYYAEQAEKHFSNPTTLPGPTGELNQLIMEGRGVIVCISPWNFPLAIFLGQITAALAAGNTVLAKPAEQTPYIAYKAVELLYQAGFPKDVIQLLPGDGESIGAGLIEHPDVAGVIFTGSTDVAKIIQNTLAQKPGPIVPLIAETGGQNAMIVDSSALPEQVVRDVVLSAFDSAGQRCSALRILCLQEDIYDTVTEMLKGAMEELSLGDPRWVQTDIGPVIDQNAQKSLLKHIKSMSKNYKTLFKSNLPKNNKNNKNLKNGYFVPACAFEIPDINILKKEQFGPILHIVSFKAKELDNLIDAINHTGYGLTFGIHSRIEETVKHISSKIKAGNIYINRNTVGAIVGVQPFGGEGLSGTGPKAGGPHYLLKLVHERTISTDTTASGGNASLMTIGE